MCVPTLGSNSAVVVVLFRDDNWTAGKIGWSGGLCAFSVSSWVGCNEAGATGGGTVSGCFV